ncbi:MAG: RrF2 family transcriptional regulator [Alphaproteobacteria bacterium]|nr:RrF2 family transcriptional regulator [Alphaproteobacteria bacterium]
MKLSTKARYAVMAMVDLAREGGSVSSSLTVISERQNLPLPYLEQLFLKLRRAELVKSARGSNGGYMLMKSPAETNIYDIIVAVDTPMKATRCKDHSPLGCQMNKTRCLTHNLWEGLENVVQSYLKTVSLEDVCRKKAMIFPKKEQHNWLSGDIN